MKKTIGTKVFLMLVILTLVFVATVLVNLKRLGDIGEINKDFTNTYIVM